MGAIERDKNYNFIILINECDECGECIKVCPVDAIVKEDRRQEW
jgi:ferredoxin